LGQPIGIYCRVSTTDQSCERQERDLTAFAARADYEVVGVFKETEFVIGAYRRSSPNFKGDIDEVRIEYFLQ
jgi:DNA invertase Pin-like site-specific DNA recombinase